MTCLTKGLERYGRKPIDLGLHDFSDGRADWVYALLLELSRHYIAGATVVLGVLHGGRF
jgi:hypothetical protein